MGKRNRRRSAAEPVATTDYTDDDGNVLTLRQITSGIPDAHVSEGSSADDRWRRGNEIRFERYAVRWVIAGLPLDKQRDLLARYRMADQATQEWVQRTIDRHIESA